MEVMDKAPRKRLYRSRKGMIGGVCQGIADYTNIEVGIIRLLALLSMIFALGGFFVYLILWIFIPLEPARIRV